MSNYDDTKKFGTNAYPVQSVDTSNLLRRCEPLITPELLKSRYLKGVDISNYTEGELKDEIEMAANEFEALSGVALFKVQDKQRLPFDRALYKSFVHMVLNHRPILSIEEILIESSNGESIYKLPADWIEMGYAHKGQINLVPILSVFGAAGLKDGQASNAGLIFIQAVNNFRWLPSFFTVTYTHGLSHKEGEVPVIANQVLGMTAAIEILSKKQTEFKYNSTSISQDGISQSASGQGPQTYKVRIEELEQKRHKMLMRIKSIFNNKYFLSNI